MCLSYVNTGADIRAREGKYVGLLQSRRWVIEEVNKSLVMDGCLSPGSTMKGKV